MAADGEEGLEKVLGHDEGYDIILTDYKMPKLDGLEFVMIL